MIFLFSSCSSLRKNVVLGSIAGATVGASGGYLFSPNEESRGKNAYLFGLIGGALSGLGTYYLLKKEERPQKSLLLEDRKMNENMSIPLFNLSDDMTGLPAKVEFKPVKKYEVPQGKLPPQLKGKVKKQILIEYETKGSTMQLKGKTIQIAPFKAWEVKYE